MYRRLPPAQSLHQAIGNAPALAHLAGLAEQSLAMYRCVQNLIPAPLRPHIRPGPLQAQDWCLMVSHGAAAAKLRQLAPLLQTRLRQEGWDVQNVRVKILAHR
jgi:hypothetical protein